uniref:Mitotic checkpoint protein bub3 n=2 Tax=Lygus hesperus TaxID=30085 RepID=A0A0A9YML6_LYGHE
MQTVGTTAAVVVAVTPTTAASIDLLLHHLLLFLYNTMKVRKIELGNPPTDYITSTTFLQLNTLCTTSWDTNVNIYDVNTFTRIHSIPYKVPLLDSCYDPTNSTIYTCGVDGSIYTVDVQHPTYQPTKFTQLQCTVQSVQYNADTASLFASTWDSSLYHWDIRSKRLVHRVALQPNTRILCMDTCVDSNTKNTKILLVGSNKNIYIFDTRKLQQPEISRPCSLAHQVRSAKFHPLTDRYILSSIEGRISVEYLYDTWKNYVFKCHRRKDPELNTTCVYSINTVAFHPQYYTCASGGDDGAFCIWDTDTRRRICTYNAMQAIHALAFSSDNTTVVLGG